MSQTPISDLLAGPEDGARIETFEKALNRLTDRGPEAEAALTAAIWYRLAGHRNGILAVFQFSEGRAREDRLWDDLDAIGAPEAAEVTRVMFTEIGIDWARLARDLPAALEAGDRILNASKAHTEAVEGARAALPGQLWAYLRQHAQVVQALDALPQQRGLLARLFGR